MTLHLHRSHRMERLAERLLELGSAPSDDPFETPFVVVQGQGMERWLAQFAARRTGIFAGVRILRVRELVKLTCDAVLSDETRVVLDPQTLPFRILAHLDAVLETPDGTALARYLGDHDDAERRMQLAERLAEVMDRYLVHRPSLIASWQAGRVADDELARAQAALFCRIALEAPAHEARRVADAAARLDRDAPLLMRTLPRRIFLFGIATLAPLYLELLHRLASVTEIHLLVLAPGEVWLSDLSSEESSRGEVGSLICGFGKLAADFQYLLEEHEGKAGLVDDYLDDPGQRAAPRTALETLQHDLITLTQRGTGDDRKPRVEVAADDRSFVVHACHSPRRELEALHEMLVDRFELDPSLEPEHVAVLAADIERYAPLIHAVFGRDAADARRLPYHVADRGPRATLGLIDAFFAIVESLTERITLPQVADLLERPAVRLRLGLEPLDIERAVHWLRDAGARWGLDPEDRARDGQPAFEEHTFERALDRLALGYASGDAGPSFAGVIPHAAAAGKESVTLGGLFRFFDALEGVRGSAAAAAPMASYVALGRRVLDTLLHAEGPFEDEAQLVRRGIANLAGRADDAGFAGDVSLAGFVRMLLAELEGSSGSGGFLGGGITFCRQVPMRAIPFRVICLLGLDDESFPRNLEPPRFDLLARAPQRGDRTPRDDDRQAFLDALLSARDALHIFHVGRDLATDDERPVSTVVTRTLEVIEGAIAPVGEATTRGLTWVDHPLHAFDPAYFFGDARERGLISRDTYAHACAASTLSPPEAPRAELSLETPAATSEVVSFDELLAFLDKPERDFVQRVLGADPGEEPSALPERESLEQGGLEAHGLRDRALAQIAAGLPPEAIAADLRGRGLLAPGMPGDLQLQEAVAFARVACAAFEPGLPRDPVPFVLDLHAVRLEGTLRDLHENGLCLRSASRLDTGRRFTAYVRHLVLSAVAPAGVPLCTMAIGRNPDRKAPRTSISTYRAALAPDRDPKALLQILVSAFLAARREPTLISADLLTVYAKARTAKRPASPALAEQEVLERLEKSLLPRASDGHGARIPAARRTLFNDAFAPRATAPTRALLGAAFADVAERVFTPVFDALGESEE